MRRYINIYALNRDMLMRVINHSYLILIWQVTCKYANEMLFYANFTGRNNTTGRNSTRSRLGMVPTTERTPTNINRSLSNLVYMYILPLQTLLQNFESIDWKPEDLRIFNFRILKFSTSKLWHLESSSWCHFKALHNLYKIHLEVKYHTSSISTVIAISIFYI